MRPMALKGLMIMMIDGLQKPCQQRDDYKNMRYVYKWILQREV